MAMYTARMGITTNGSLHGQIAADDSKVRQAASNMTALIQALIS